MLNAYEECTLPKSINMSTSELEHNSSIRCHGLLDTSSPIYQQISAASRSESAAPRLFSLRRRLPMHTQTLAHYMDECILSSEVVDVGLSRDMCCLERCSMAFSDGASGSTHGLCMMNPERGLLPGSASASTVRTAMFDCTSRTRRESAQPDHPADSVIKRDQPLAIPRAAHRSLRRHSSSLLPASTPLKHSQCSRPCPRCSPSPSPKPPSQPQIPQCPSHS